MKNTTYCCDRCGDMLKEDGAALERMRFCTQERITYKLNFFGKWKTEARAPVVYELCERCRESLDGWLGINEE